MRAASCPDFSWHKGQHDAANRRIEGFLADIEAGSVEAAGELTEYLGKWFKDHMALSDRMMGAHVRNHGRLHAIAS